jgi:hypothetical protein
MTTATVRKNGYVKAVQRLDRKVEKTTGLDLQELLTAGTIAASFVLYITGRRGFSLFFGLLPTILALRAAQSED